MKIKVLIVLLTTLLLLSLGIGPAYSFSILFPPDNSYVKTDSVYFIMKNDPKKIDSYQIYVNKFGYPKTPVPEDQTFFYQKVYLTRGLNTIKFTGYTDKEVAVTRKYNIYYRNSMISRSSEPEDYKRYFFHTPENEKLCTECHQMEVTEDDTYPDSPQDSPCFTCHSDKLDVKYVHSPVSEWTCMECHSISPDKRKYETPEVSELCYMCHDSEIDEWKEAKHMHGPAAVGQCTLCHSPHGSDWPAFTRMHPTDLCLICHSDKESGKHVLAGFSNKGHPMRGVPDPRDNSKEFSCASCHNPHASSTNSLLRYPRFDGKKAFCQHCHNK